jgi:hypothetical protein
VTTVDRTAWPWNAAPPGIDDYDEAAWYAVRATSDGELPRQDLETWILEQRARRTRDVLPPRLMTEADHEQLRDDLILAWAHPVPTRYVGALPR